MYRAFWLTVAWMSVIGVLAVFFWALSFISAFIIGSAASLIVEVDVLGNALLVANYVVASGALIVVIAHTFGVRVVSVKEDE